MKWEERKIKIRFCPKCKSENVEMNATPLSAVAGINPGWICNKCGFNSLEFPEKELKLNKKKKGKKK